MGLDLNLILATVIYKDGGAAGRGCWLLCYHEIQEVSGKQ